MPPRIPPVPDDPLHQANAKLFRQGLGDPETAAGFLSAYLPGRIAAAVNWSKLRLEPGSFVDFNFRKHESDLVFSAPLADREAVFYFLFEHQTNEDPAIALRLLRYMVCIWEERLRSHPKRPLPVILPVVLAQNERAWKQRPEFAALLDLPADLADDLRPFIPYFVFRLIQLAEIPFDAIRGTPAGIMVLRVMKAERTNNLLAGPVWDEELLRQVSHEVFEMLLRFMMNADLDTAAIECNIKSIQTPQLKHTAMTLAQKLRQEGHKEGRQEGRLVALRENVTEALEIRFGGLPGGLREAIDGMADEATLRTLHRAAIQCPTLEAFAAEL